MSHLWHYQPCTSYQRGRGRGLLARRLAFLFLLLLLLQLLREVARLIARAKAHLFHEGAVPVPGSGSGSGSGTGLGTDRSGHAWVMAAPALPTSQVCHVWPEAPSQPRVAMLSQGPSPLGDPHGEVMHQLDGSEPG